MNRVTRLLQKAHFLYRHRNLLAYSHKYVITADNLTQAPQTASTTGSSGAETLEMIDELLRDSDVEGNETDRRIYFEVMGRQIGWSEPDDRDSSDEDWGLLKAFDAKVHAIYELTSRRTRSF